ncbi:hypothetical protein [Tepidimicrobium xylanilyticum]|uniref:hypothetical protein n=1 Tax=Tepidimicrobium xylanilyticum TaxID=1123352 RepID=UPI0026511DB6|nr:hypothetical protein [Tepidimicrobium xylanilyticum]GMG96702.1 ABC transporter permease [Tepidimicrobium xylanilyticum]
MGKLMKYEIKGSYKFILGVLALVLILTTGIYAYIVNNKGGSPAGALFVGLSVLIIFGSLLTTFLYIVSSFRKELYEDRGYLTFTLPLTGNQVLGAKLIVALMWFTILAIVIVVYHLIMLSIFAPTEFSISQLFSRATSAALPYKEIITTIILGFINGTLTLILIYFSMALSRVTFRNKKIGGFWFVVFLVLNGIITYSQIKIAQLIPYYLDISTFTIGSMDILSHGFHVDVDRYGIMMAGDFGNILFNIPSFIYSIIIGIVMFLGTGYLIENKIDI